VRAVWFPLLAMVPQGIAARNGAHAALVVQAGKPRSRPKPFNHQGHEGTRRKRLRPKAFVILRDLGGSEFCVASLH
jgi:hypothetical protein